MNYHNIVTNNCNEVAIGAWNYTFDVDEFDMTPFPKGLKKQIQSKNNWHSISLQRISTWGKERYIKLNDYFDRLNYFNDFLYVLY